MLMFQNNETAAMLLFQTKPVGVDPFYEIFAGSNFCDFFSYPQK